MGNKMNIRSQLKGSCRHFINVRDNKECKAGMVYDEVTKRKELGERGCMLRLPCTGKDVGTVTRGHAVQCCSNYDSLTAEEIEKEEKDIHRILDQIKKGLSPCCGVAIDESCVITKGQYKGHGPRFCSKCKRVVYMV